MSDFLLCILLGIAVSAPIGAVGTVCLKNQLMYGRQMCILSGIACGLADATYGLLAALSFTRFIETVQNHLISLQIGGITLLSLTGLFLFLDKKTYLDELKKNGDANHKVKKLIHLFFLTLINPSTAIAIPGIMAAAGLFDEAIPTLNAYLMALGIVCGTTLWWTSVSFFVPLFQHKISNRLLQRVNHITGSILMLSASSLLVHLLVFS